MEFNSGFKGLIKPLSEVQQRREPIRTLLAVITFRQHLSRWKEPTYVAERKLVDPMSRRKWCLRGRCHPFAVQLPSLNTSHEWKGLQCVISDFRRGVNEVFGYSGMLTQSWLVVCYRSFGTPYRSHLQGAMIQLDPLWMLLRSSCPDENCAWRDLSYNRTPFASALVNRLYEMLIYF